MSETPPAPRRPHGPPVDLRVAQLRGGHAEISATIALDAAASNVPPLEEAKARLMAIWPPAWRPGTFPAFEEVTSTTLQGRLVELVNRHIVSGDPICRFLLNRGAEPRVAIVAHHALLDGLGLVASLSAVLGQDLATSSRGIDPNEVTPAGPAYGLSRLGEALLVPPTRIAPDVQASWLGDHLMRMDLPPIRVTTAALVAAAAQAVIAWNGKHGRRAERIVVAVGAARGGGRALSLDPRAAWFRLRVDDPRPDAVQRHLEEATPEPVWTSSVLTTTSGAWLARRLAHRTGSTLLVSNLGRLEPAGSVRAAAFYTMAHGRSGVSVGCLTAPDATVLTLRARRSDFSVTGGNELLQLIADRIRDPDTASRPEPHSGG